MAAVAVGAGAGPVVGHGEREGARLVADRHGRVRRSRVLEGVGQRLLHDPVGREIDTRRQRQRLAGDRHVDLEPGGAHLLHQPRELVEARVRGQRQALAVAAQHPEQAPHLDHRLAGDDLDAGEIGRLALVLGPEAAPDRLRLHGDDADRVRHDVVQLARDARPLGLDGGRLDLLALELELLGARGQLLDAVPARPQGLGQRPRADVDDHHEDEVAAVLAEGEDGEEVGGDDDGRRRHARRGGSS